eukprot:gene15113-17871_t
MDLKHNLDRVEPAVGTVTPAAESASSYDSAIAFVAKAQASSPDASCEPDVTPAAQVGGAEDELAAVSEAAKVATEAMSTPADEPATVSEVAQKSAEAACSTSASEASSKHPTWAARTGGTEETGTHPTSEKTDEHLRETAIQPEAAGSTAVKSVEKRPEPEEAELTASIPSAPADDAELTIDTPSAPAGEAVLTTDTPSATTEDAVCTADTPSAHADDTELTADNPPTPAEELTADNPSASAEEAVLTTNTPSAPTDDAELTANTPSAPAGEASLEADTASAPAEEAVLTTDTLSAPAEEAVCKADTPSVPADDAELTTDNPSAPAEDAVCTADNPPTPAEDAELATDTPSAPAGEASLEADTASAPAEEAVCKADTPSAPADDAELTADTPPAPAEALPAVSSEEDGAQAAAERAEDMEREQQAKEMEQRVRYQLTEKGKSLARAFHEELIQQWKAADAGASGASGSAEVRGAAREAGLTQMRGRVFGEVSEEEAYTTFITFGRMLGVAGFRALAPVMYRTAAELEPGFVEPHLLLGENAHRMGLREEANDHYARALMRAQASIERGDTGLARVWLRRVQMNLGILQESEGMLLRACQHYRAAVTADPDHAPSLKLLGSAMFALGELEVARTALQRSLELDPSSGAAWCDLGVTLQALQLAEDATVAFQRAIELGPAAVGGLAAYNLGNQRLVQADWAGAVEMYDIVIALAPGNWRAINNKACALLQLGQVAVPQDEPWPPDQCRIGQVAVPQDEPWPSDQCRMGQ